MEEKKIGAIPHVNVATAFGPKEYGLLVTEERTIFAILKETSKLGWAIGGTLLSDAMGEDRHVNLEDTSADNLACYSGSICVPHNSLEQIQFKKTLGAHRMLMKYRNEKGKKKALDVFLVPAPEYFEKMKTTGVKPKEAREQYARNVQEVYRRALPLTVSTNAKWFK